MKFTVVVIIAPGKIVSIANYENENKVEPKTLLKESDNMIDDFE